MSLPRRALARPVIELALIRYAQAPEPCQKRGKVGSVKQRLLAKLDAFEVTTLFDRCVQRAADTEQLKCLVDRIRYFRKTKGRRVDRINSNAYARHCLVRRTGAASECREFPKPDRPTGRTAQPEYSADTNDQVGLPVRVIVNRDLVLEPYRG